MVTYYRIDVLVTVKSNLEKESRSRQSAKQRRQATLLDPDAGDSQTPHGTSGRHSNCSHVSWEAATSTR